MNTPVEQKTEFRPKYIHPFYPPPDASLDTPWQIEVYCATYERERWHRHQEIANRSFAARGLQAVGEERTVDIDEYPTYVAEAMIDGLNPVGGVRIHLNNCMGEIPLLEEIVGYTDITTLRSYLQPLQSEGVVHGSGLWIDPTQRHPGLVGDLARALYVMFTATPPKWHVGCTHQYILDAWASVGWPEFMDVQRFFYPDERYQSCIVLGHEDTWPDEIRGWAIEQTSGLILDGSDIQFTIQPMRLTTHSRRQFCRIA